MVRNVFERFYNSYFDSFEYCGITDEKTGITDFSEVIRLKDIPCRICIKGLYETVQGRVANYKRQTIVLMTSPDIEVKAGSKIVVKSEGREEIYQNSGQPFFYNSHQEIVLSIFKGWA